MPNVTIYDVGKAARYLGVNRRTVYRWIDSGALNALIIGGIVYVELEVLDQFVDRHPDDYEPEEEE